MSPTETPSHPRIWKSGIEDYLIENIVDCEKTTPLQSGTSCYLWRLDAFRPPQTPGRHNIRQPAVLKCADSTPKYSDMPVAVDRLKVEIKALQSRIVAEACRQEPRVHVPSVLQTTENGFVMSWAGEKDLRTAHNTKIALDFAAIGASLGKWLACLHRSGATEGQDGWDPHNAELLKWYGKDGLEDETIAAVIPSEDERARVTTLLHTPDHIRTLTPWDFRPMNILVQEEEGDEAGRHISVVDWELCHYGEPFNDVRMFFVEAVVMEAQHGDHGLLSSFLQAYRSHSSPEVVNNTFTRKIAASAGIFMLFLMSAGPQVWDCTEQDVQDWRAKGIEYLKAAAADDMVFLRSTSLKFLLDG